MIVKVLGKLGVSPSTLFTTITWAVPACAISAAVIWACNWVFEILVVIRSELFQRTTGLYKKLVPLTVSTKAGLPAFFDEGTILVIVGTVITPLKGPKAIAQHDSSGVNNWLIFISCV